MKKKAKSRPSNLKKPVLLTTRKKKDYPYLALGGILIFTTILFSNSLHNEILNFDDIEYFTNYPEIRQLSWESVSKYFTHYYVIMYQPLPILTFALNYYFSGTSTFPMHMVNLCFHLLNIILVFYLTKQIVNNINTALFIALIFAIHPMNVESVTWISARSTGMFTSFYILSLIFYLKYLNKKNYLKYLLLSGLFFIFSLFSKAQSVTLPVVILAIDYYYKRKLWSRKLILEKIPFFILSIIFGIITLMDKGTIKNIDRMVISYSGIDIFFLHCHTLSFYFLKFLMPVNLCSIYVYPPKSGSYLPLEYYFSALLILGIAYILFRYRKNRHLIFGTFVFLISISINMQLIPSRLTIVADRYTYFPYIGLLFITGFSYTRWKENHAVQFRKYKSLIILLFIGYIVFFSYAVCNRYKVWKNDMTMMTDIIAKNPEVPYIARAYGNLGNYVAKLNRNDEAVQYFSKAINIKKDDAQTYYNRALSYIALNKNTEALDDLDSALKYEPNTALIFSNRAYVKYVLNDSVGALADCNKSIMLDSTIPAAYNTRAAIDFQRKDYKKCEYDLSKAIMLNPDFADAYKNRGLLYQATGRMKEACSDWEKASGLGQTQATDLLKQYCK